MRRTTTQHLFLTFTFTIAVLLFPALLAAQAGFIPAMPQGNVAVEYPIDLTPALTETTVTFAVSVDEQGKVDSVTIVRPANPQLDAAVSKAISHWQFTPATQNGKPIRSDATIDVVFSNLHPYVVPNGIYRVGMGGVTPPTTIYAPDPKDTPAGRKDKVKGAVILWVVLNKEGSPEYIRVQKSVDPIRDQNSIEAVKLWKFTPALKDGKPVPVMINVELKFPFY